jgi:ribosomal protein S18 acetylase RimI-like enzyme
VFAIDEEARVCPFCGNPPGPGVFCEACGRNLQAVERLPTRAEREGEQRVGAAGMRPLEERCADATAAFLAALRTAGNPGAVRTPMSKRSAFRRAGSANGWVLRPVDREDFEKPRRYEPGLVLTVEGRFHRLHSELRGWGQRDFPHYHHTVEPDAVDMPVEERLISELATVLEAHGLGDTETSVD